MTVGLISSKCRAPGHCIGFCASQLSTSAGFLKDNTYTVISVQLVTLTISDWRFTTIHHNPYLVIWNDPSGIILHDRLDNFIDLVVMFATPYKIITRELDEDFILTRKNRKVDDRLGIGHILICCDGTHSRIDSFIDAENQKYKEQWWKDLEKSSLLVTPSEDCILPS